MRTSEQIERIRELMRVMESRPDDVGPWDMRWNRMGLSAVCAGDRVVTLSSFAIRRTALDVAHEMALVDDPGRYTHRFLGLGPARPDRRRIEREYYGFTGAEVKRLRNAARAPMRFDVTDELTEAAVRGRWFHAQCDALRSVMDLPMVQLPAPSFTPQPVHCDEMFVVVVQSASDGEQDRSPEWSREVVST